MQLTDRGARQSKDKSVPSSLGGSSRHRYGCSHDSELEVDAACELGASNRAGRSGAVLKNPASDQVPVMNRLFLASFAIPQLCSPATEGRSAM